MTESVFETFDENRKALMQKRRDLLVAVEKVVAGFHCEFFHAVQTKPVVSDEGGVYIEGFGVCRQTHGKGWGVYAKTSCGMRLFIDANRGQLANAGGPKLGVRGSIVIRSFLEHIEGFLGAIKPSLELHLADEEALISRAEQSLTGFVARNSLEAAEHDY